VSRVLVSCACSVVSVVLTPVMDGRWVMNSCCVVTIDWQLPAAGAAGVCLSVHHCNSFMSCCQLVLASQFTVVHCRMRINYYFSIICTDVVRLKTWSGSAANTCSRCFIFTNIISTTSPLSLVVLIFLFSPLTVDMFLIESMSKIVQIFWQL